ncbi:mandelate racemase [Cobetia sp. UIB-001]|uniref:mandelate racemase/muconate lactonizing enzyme family protein n=1 Tax=Cobetia sp. UIB-001 TaxID=2717697 RepID=UPI00385137AA
MSSITAMTIWKVDLTSHVPYYMGGGKTCDSVPSIIIRLDTDDGLSGWGEVCPIPHYLPAYADGVLPAITELAPSLLGANPVGPERLIAKLDRQLIGHPYAKSAIDIALWDITAKSAGMPLYQLLGGLQTERLPLYLSITCSAPKTMANMAREYYAAGIRQFQVKLGADNNWRHDVDRLIAVREAVGEGPLVYGDWNCCASQLDATRAARAVSHLDIMIEQPCETMESCDAVRQASGLTMKLDENVHDIHSLLKGYHLGCMDAAAIKLSKFGGLSPARRARDLCASLGIKMVIEDTWGSDIATTAALHLATATAEKDILNVCNLADYVSPRLDPESYTVKEGVVSVNSRPGLGVSPDPKALGQPLAEFSL